MQEHQSPGLLRRLAALLYDSLLILPLITFLVALAMGAQAIAGGGDDSQIAPLLVQMLAVLGVVGFYIAFWRIKGQTLGMQAWRIQLLDFDGKPPSAERCALRCLAAIVSLAPAGLGFWWCLFDPHNRYWHDYLSGTELTLLPKPDKKK